MKMKMENICSDFLNKLQNLVIELQLNELNYVQIDKEKQQKAEKLYKEGYSLYWDEDDYNGAISLFNQSLILNPKHKFSLWGKGSALRMLDQYKESIEWYDQALVIDPSHVNSICGKGMRQALRGMGQYKESIEWYDKALAIDPNHVNSLFGILYDLTFQDKHYECRVNMRNLLNGSTGNRAQSCELIMRERQDHKSIIQGASLNSIEKYQEGFDVLSQVLELNPSNQFGLNQMRISKEQLQK